MLHVLNGDATAKVFAEAGLPGEVLVWRDILVEGPVAKNWTEPAPLALRAAYLAERIGIDAGQYVSGVRAQEEALSSSRDHDEVVLWFEQDLFCAVNLWYVLTRLGHRPARRLSLVYPPTDDARGLGVLTPAQLATLFGERQPVTAAMLQAGHQAWEAYIGADPGVAGSLAFPSAPVSPAREPLPFVRDALRCHLGRFPSVGTGLSEVETVTLHVLEGGPRRFGDLFRVVTADVRGRRHGMGDVQLAACVRGLVPLVNLSGADVINAKIVVTALGREVRTGRRDSLDVRAIDVWLGGVHLADARPRWRRDAATGRLVKSPT